MHGNLAALDAVLAEPHDALICLGDMVGYGPHPGACVRRIRERAALVLRGNHDQALATGQPPGCRPNFQWLAEATAHLGATQLSAVERAALAELPTRAARTLDGVRATLVHATPSDPLYRYLAPESDDWMREIQTVDTDVLLVGHTHLQFRLEVGGRTIVNPGSVGQPKDGDPRAAYAVITNGAITLHRAAYPIEQTIADLERSGVEPAAVAALAQLLRSGRNPLSRGAAASP